MSWAAIAGAVVGVVGTVVSSNSAADAADEASAAQLNAANRNINLASEQRRRNEAMFGQYLGDEALAQAYLDALQYGEATYRPGANGVSTPSMNPVGIDGMLRGTYPELWAEFRSLGAHTAGEFHGWITQRLGRDPMLDGSVQPEAPQNITRADVLEMLQGTPLAQYAETAFDDREDLASEALSGSNALADDEYSDITSAADLNYADLNALAERARAGRLTRSEQNLVQRLALEDESFAAWLPQSQQAEQDAINLNFSRGGVNGLVGQTREGVGRTTQDAAMDRNLRLLEGRQAAYQPYFNETTGIETDYYNDLGEAEAARGDTRLDATALRGGRRQSAYDTYSGRRAGNYDSLAGDRVAAYSDFTGYLTDRTRTGYNARSQIAAGGQAYVNTATQANNQAGAAQRDAAYQRGAIQQQMYGDLARIAGDAWGTITNRNKGTGVTGTPSAGYSSVGGKS